MSHDVLAWPAFGEGKAFLPDKLHYETGVWGKVPGARSDFRWIARSSHFDPGDQNLALQQLSLGTEDRPGRSHLWHSQGSLCHAASLYPSRAQDASGRTDFIEKQVLVWNRPKGVPAVLGALLLLSQAGSSDQLWWDRHEEGRWTDPGYSLPLPDSAHKPLDVSEEELATEVEQGIAELIEAVKPENLPLLEKLYSQLLEGHRPAWLTGLDRPLSPRALAALLLPLPADLANSLRLASWIPSRRLSVQGLADRWDVLVLPPELTDMATLPEARPSQKAESMVMALRDRDPDWLAVGASALSDVEPVTAAEPDEPVSQDVVTSSPVHAQTSGTGVPLSPPPPGASDLLKEIHAFACAADRRWLDPDRLREHFSTARSERVPERLFPSWIEELRARRPQFADPEQWNVKLDLLRSAALLLRPATGTLQAVGAPESDRIPLLLYPLLLGGWDHLKNLSEEERERALQQSQDCKRPNPWQRRVLKEIKRPATDPKKSPRRSKR